MNASAKAIATVHALLAVTLGLILLERLDTVLPALPARLLTQNVEGVALALGLGLWLCPIRRWLGSAALGVALVLGAGCLLAGWWLLAGPLSHPEHSRFITLNETMLALAVLLPYLEIRRPLRWWAAALPVAAFTLPVVAAGRSETVTTMAEVFAAVVLVAITVDLVDPSLLDGSSPHRWRSLAWLGLLSALVVVFRVWADWNEPEGFFGHVLLYLARGNEMFLAVIGLTLLFGVLCPQAQRAGATASARLQDPAGSAAGQRTRHPAR